MYSYLVGDNSEHKCVNKSKYKNFCKQKFCCDKSHNEYKDVLLNNKCLRNSINNIQSKDHNIETYEINKTSLPCFDDKMNVMDQLLVIEDNRKKRLLYLNNYYKKIFCQANCFNFQSNLSGQLVCQANYFNCKTNQDSFLASHIKLEKRRALLKKR